MSLFSFDCVSVEEGAYLIWNQWIWYEYGMFMLYEVADQSRVKNRAGFE